MTGMLAAVGAVLGSLGIAVLIGYILVVSIRDAWRDGHLVAAVGLALVLLGLALLAIAGVVMLITGNVTTAS